MRRPAHADRGRELNHLILASASPRRRELLAALLADFDVHASGAEEDSTGNPGEAAVRLARMKAAEIGQRHPGATVVGADTIVHDGRQPYGKPEDETDAIRMLNDLRGRTHTVFTGIAVMDAAGSCLTALSETAVTLSHLTDAQIADYVRSGRPLDKAGAYAIQDEDIPTVASYNGCYCSVMGLPLWKLRTLLKAVGHEAAQPNGHLPRCTTCPER